MRNDDRDVTNDEQDAWSFLSYRWPVNRYSLWPVIWASCLWNSIGLIDVRVELACHEPEWLMKHVSLDTKISQLSVKRPCRETTALSCPVMILSFLSTVRGCCTVRKRCVAGGDLDHPIDISCKPSIAILCDCAYLPPVSSSSTFTSIHEPWTFSSFPLYNIIWQKERSTHFMYHWWPLVSNRHMAHTNVSPVLPAKMGSLLRSL